MAAALVRRRPALPRCCAASSLLPPCTASSSSFSRPELGPSFAEYPAGAAVHAAANSRRNFAKARKDIHRAFETEDQPHKDMNNENPSAFMQAQMYTPEAVKSDALARNCHRMVMYDMALPDLLDRYAERAVELSPWFQPWHFSVIIGAFAKASHRHDGMFKTFKKKFPSHLQHFTPRDFGFTLAALAKFREREESLMKRFSSELPHKLPLFGGNQLRQVAGAYARLDVRDELLFDDIADEFMRRPQEMDHVDLLLLASAYAHFKLSSTRLWFVLCDWLVQSYLDFTPRQMVMAANALSAVEFEHEPLLRNLARSFSDPEVLEELEPTDLGLALNAFARLRWQGPGSEEALAALAGRAGECLDEATPAVVMQMLHACTKFDTLRRNDAFTGLLMKRSSTFVNDCNAQSLSLLVNCCAKLHLRDVQLLTQVAKAVTKRVKDFSPQSLAMIAHGFAKLEVRSEILFYLLAAAIVKDMPQFTGQGVGMILNAYGKLKIKNDKLVTAARKHVKVLAEELTLAEVDSIESGFRNLEVLDQHMQSLLRTARRQLVAAGAVPAGAAARAAPRSGSPVPPGLGGLDEEDDDDLMMRLAVQGAGGREQRPEPGALPAEAEAEKAGAEVESVARPGVAGAAAGRDPNLWEMWGDADAEASRAAQASSSPGSAGGQTHDDSGIWVVGEPVAGAAAPPPGDGATPKGALREYLAQQSRPGRRPVVLDEDPAPGLGGPGEAGGRRGRRRPKPRD